MAASSFPLQHSVVDEQLGVIRFLTAEGVPVTDIHRRMVAVYGGENCVSDKEVAIMQGSAKKDASASTKKSVKEGAKDSKQSKESKHSKEAKDGKGEVAELKESKAASKGSKENRESKDNKNADDRDNSRGDPNGPTGQDSPSRKERGTPKPGFPLTRIKMIMKSAPEVNTLSVDAVALTARAAELFVVHLANESLKKGSTGTVDYEDIYAVVHDNPVLDFLYDIIPQKVTYKECIDEIREAERREKELLEQIEI